VALSRLCAHTYVGRLLTAIFQLNLGVSCFITFRVSHRRREMHSGHGRQCVCLCVCLSFVSLPHYCTDPDVTEGIVGVPLVVHCWADLQPVHGVRCFDNTARTRNVSECLYSLCAWFIFIFHLLWPPCVADADIIFSSCGFFFFLLSSFFFFFPRLISEVAEWMCTIPHHTWCGLNGNLECRSEICSLKIQDVKMTQKNRHLLTVAPRCRAESSQLRHVSIIGKKIVKQQMSPQYSERRPISG